jgi:hypothetical protein
LAVVQWSDKFVCFVYKNFVESILKIVYKRLIWEKNGCTNMIDLGLRAGDPDVTTETFKWKSAEFA